jgi:hypothetical protein
MENTSVGVHTKAQDAGWVNTTDGVVRSSHDTKKAAVAAGRLLAKRHGMQHTIHREDGSVISTKSYERSPL